MVIGKFDENILSEARHVDSERTSNLSWWRCSAKWSAPHSLIGQCQPQRLCLCSWSGTVRKVDQWFAFFFRFLWNIFWHWFKSCYDVITITREVARTWYSRLPMSPWDKMMTALTNVYFHFFIIQTNAVPQLFLYSIDRLSLLCTRACFTIVSKSKTFSIHFLEETNFRFISFPNVKTNQNETFRDFNRHWFCCFRVFHFLAT